MEVMNGFDEKRGKKGAASWEELQGCKFVHELYRTRLDRVVMQQIKQTNK